MLFCAAWFARKVSIQSTDVMEKGFSCKPSCSLSLIKINSNLQKNECVCICVLENTLISYVMLLGTLTFRICWTKTHFCSSASIRHHRGF